MPSAYKTCDICRKRKTKCLPPPDDNDKHDKRAPCVNCARLGISCTYDHVYKRPGRPTSFARADAETEERFTSPTASPGPSQQFPAQPALFTPTIFQLPGAGFDSPLDPLFVPKGDGILSEWSEHDLVTDWPTGSTNAKSNIDAPAPPFIAPPPPAPAETSTRLQGDIQIEDVAPWHTISYFITIYLSYSHSLFPLVHRPSFSQSLALRRDKTDRDFRAFVLGIVAYTIGQSPLSRMEQFDRVELASLQHKCHRSSMMLLDRSYRSPNVLHVGTLMTGYFYCQSVGKTNRALTLIAEACQLMHLMRMHDDENTMGLDAVDIQIRRRIWWHVYAVDITEASAGNVIHLNAFEGRPSLPLQVDDEFLTSQGSFPQPSTYTSYLQGFGACIRQFPLLEEPITRLRTLQYRRRQGRHLAYTEVEAEVRWIESARVDLENIMQGLPDILKLGWTFDEPMDEIRLAVMGMQRANLAITAVSIKFALADYKAELLDQTSDAERAAMGKEAYETLSCIGIDDLAANGESMRGKIFRILLALLKCNGESQDWFNTLQDWWSLFSRVQFVQLMANVDSRLPSRMNSPDV